MLQKSTGQSSQLTELELCSAEHTACSPDLNVVGSSSNVMGEMHSDAAIRKHFSLLSPPCLLLEWLLVAHGTVARLQSATARRKS